MTIRQKRLYYHSQDFTTSFTADGCQIGFPIPDFSFTFAPVPDFWLWRATWISHPHLKAKKAQREHFIFLTFIYPHNSKNKNKTQKQSQENLPKFSTPSKDSPIILALFSQHMQGRYRKTSHMANIQDRYYDRVMHKVSGNKEKWHQSQPLGGGEGQEVP